MIQFATKAQFNFDGLPGSFSAASIATAVYTTPEMMMETLGDLSRLTYLRASLKAKIKLSTSDTAEFTVKVTDGVNTLASVTVDVVADDEGFAELENINLSNLSGSDKLRVVVDVVEAAAGGVTGQVYCALNLESPIVLMA